MELPGKVQLRVCILNTGVLVDPCRSTGLSPCFHMLVKVLHNCGDVERSVGSLVSGRI